MVLTGPGDFRYGLLVPAADFCVAAERMVFFAGPVEFTNGLVAPAASFCIAAVRMVLAGPMEFVDDLVAGWVTVLQ